MDGDARLGAPETGEGKTLVIDFGGPNVAKPMHVGHLRSAIIGDCLQRLFRANGWEVMSDVHLGDWGLQMGQLISEIGHPRHRADLFRRELHRSLSRRIAGYDGRSGGDLSGGRRRLQSRSGAAGRGARGHGRTAGGPARLSRAVAAFLHGLRGGPEARIWKPRRSVRSVERRGRRRSADRADGRGSEGARACGDERRRAGRSRGRADRQEGNAAADPA